MSNSLIVRLRERGGNLVVTVPRQLWRELGWARRDAIRVFRSGPSTITLTLAEVKARDASDVPEH